MSSRSYVPRHSAVPPKPERGGARVGTALVTTLGATALASTALAGPAEARGHHTVWDKVAYCESGKRWHVNTGNGYYGGVQFSSSTWRAYGGHKYAWQANRATRAEQIEVARRVLAKQGRGAWPVCGPRAGLTKYTGHATSAALPRVAGTTSYSSSHHKTHSRTKHKSHHTKTYGHHKSRTHGYHVHSGDTLSSIAHKFHVSGGWHALYHANRHRLSNPNVIHVGQYLHIP